MMGKSWEDPQGQKLERKTWNDTGGIDSSQSGWKPWEHVGNGGRAHPRRAVRVIWASTYSCPTPYTSTTQETLDFVF